MKKLPLLSLFLLFVLVGIACKQQPSAVKHPQPTFVQGRYAYVPSRLGVQIIDINTPTRPEIVGNLPTAGQVVRTQVKGDYLYALKIEGWDSANGTQTPSGVIVASLDDPLRPQLLTFLPSTYGAYEMLATDTHLLVSDWGETRIYNIANPAEASLQTTLPRKYDGFTQAADGTVYGGWSSCYFRSGGCTGGLTIFDFTGAEPIAKASYEYDSLGIFDLTLVGDLLYLLGNQFIIAQRDTLADLPEPLPDIVAINGRVIGQTADALFTDTGQEIRSFIITDPLAPEYGAVKEAAPPGTYFLETTLHKQYAFLVSEYGFHVLNVADPQNMFGAGYVALEG